MVWHTDAAHLRPASRALDAARLTALDLDPPAPCPNDAIALDSRFADSLFEQLATARHPLVRVSRFLVGDLHVLEPRDRPSTLSRSVVLGLGQHHDNASEPFHGIFSGAFGIWQGQRIAEVVGTEKHRA